MADLDSASKRTSSVGWGLVWMLAPPIPDGTLNQGDRQHVGFSYSGIAAAAVAALAFVLDLNTRLCVFLRDFYSQPTGELTTLASKYLREEVSGDMNVRFRQLVTDANTAMGA